MSVLTSQPPASRPPQGLVAAAGAPAGLAVQDLLTLPGPAPKLIRWRFGQEGQDGNEDNACCIYVRVGRIDQRLQHPAEWCRGH
jgi:hypothetical protein